jgi:hypothetical protein
VTDVLLWVLLLLLFLVFFIAPLCVLYRVLRKPAEPRPEADPRGRRARQTLAGVIIAVAAAMALYLFLVEGRLEQTAALFVGVPALLAVLVVVTARPVSLLGTIMKAVTIGLLMAGMFLGEGMICLLMSAPLFYAIAAVIGAAFENRRRRRGEVVSGFLLLALVPMSFEGVTPWLSLPRAERVVVEREVAAPPAEVARALALPPHFMARLPFFLRLGFPRPVAVAGAGLSPGSRRTIHFAGGEGKPGDLVLEIAESGPDRVRFRVLADHSKVAHWLAWQDAVVEWTPAGSGRTRVRWTQEFRRDLDPAWYFSPWERYAVRLAAGYLIESAAVPRGAR